MENGILTDTIPRVYFDYAAIEEYTLNHKWLHVMI